MDGEKKLPDVSHILRLSSFIYRGKKTMIENFISWWWPFCYFSRGIPIEFGAPNPLPGQHLSSV